ncbi:MAG: hypothetical protein LBE09_05680 [Christensenellaceae bacterium]|nr:hypothetical protein [Christensenellaceae bacterium]
MSRFNITKLKELIKKARAIKNIEIIVAVSVVCVIVLVVTAFNKDKGTTTESEKNVGVSQTITLSLETRLAAILSEIDGAGTVKVLIAFDGTPEIVTANTTNSHKNTASSSTSQTVSDTETISPIVVNNNGRSELIIIKEIMPDIKGVIIVAKGASNIKVRLELLRAAQAALGLGANMIEVFAMK